MTNFEAEKDRIIRKLMNDPVFFAQAILGFEPFEYQKNLLRDVAKRMIVCAGRQAGKSLIAAVKAIHFAFVNPGSRIMIISATLRQSSLMFDKIMNLIIQCPVVVECASYHSRTKIGFNNGSEILALPCGKDGYMIRGHTLDMAIVDEAAFVPTNVITSVVMPMLSTRDGSMILISTPYGRDHYFYRAFCSPDWSKHKFTSESNPLISKDFLEARRADGEMAYRCEYLAEFIDDDKIYFPMSLLMACVHTCDNPMDCEYCQIRSGHLASTNLLYGGYDPGGKVDPAAFVITDVSQGAVRCLFETRYLKSKIDDREDENLYTRFTVRISDLNKTKNWKMHQMLTDSQGLGQPIIEHCRSLNLPCIGMPMTVKNKQTIFTFLRLQLENKKIVLPNDKDLLSNLNCIEADRTRNGGFEFSHRNGSHDDLGFALALATYAAAGRRTPTVIMNTS